MKLLPPKIRRFLNDKTQCDLMVIGIVICHFIALSITNILIYSNYYDNVQAYGYADEAKIEKMKEELDMWQTKNEANPVVRQLFDTFGFLGIIFPEIILFSLIAYYFCYLRHKLSPEELSYIISIIFLIMLFDAVHDLSVFIGALYYQQTGWLTGFKDALSLNVTKVIGGLT